MPVRFIKASWLFILFASVLAVSAQNLIANGDPNPESTKNSSPSPAAGEQQKKKPGTQTTAAQKRPAPSLKPVIPIRQPSTQTSRDTTNNETQDPCEWWGQSFYCWIRSVNFGTAADWGLVLIGIVTAVVALRTLRNIETQSKAAKDAATAALEEARAITLSERAYVKISHYPPGLERVLQTNFYDVHLKIKNFGQTPANVTSVVLTHKIVSHDSELPTVPEYTPGTGQLIRKLFLVREDEFSTYVTFTFLSRDFALIDNGTNDLCVYGYVDYIDQFGNRHRAGYARRYDPRVNVRTPDMTDDQFNNRSNLHYITQPGYNYDRPRGHGEGNDWDEPM